MLIRQHHDAGILSLENLASVIKWGAGLSFCIETCPDDEPHKYC